MACSFDGYPFRGTAGSRSLLSYVSAWVNGWLQGLARSEQGSPEFVGNTRLLWGSCDDFSLFSRTSLYSCPIEACAAGELHLYEIWITTLLRNPVKASSKRTFYTVLAKLGCMMCPYQLNRYQPPLATSRFRNKETGVSADHGTAARVILPGLQALSGLKVLYSRLAGSD